MAMFKNVTPFLLIYLSVLILYFPIFSVYFSQDDFFHFRASLTDGSIVGFVKLFGFPSFEERGYAFYRPFSREGLYNIYYNLFDLNVVPFRILQLIIHFINTTLVYFLVKNLFQDKKVAYFTSFFFSVSAVNVGVLYYLAGGIETSLATLFITSTLLLFAAKNTWLKILSFITFILGLASHEVSVIIPVLLTCMILVKGKSIFNKKVCLMIFKKTWLFYVTLLVYLYLDVVTIGFHQGDIQYKPIFSINTIVNTLMWYTGWAFGVPEMLVDFVQPGLKLNPTLMRYWGEYFTTIFSAFFISIGILVLFSSYLLLKQRKIFKSLVLGYFIFWFVLSIFPVVLLPQHKFLHYLAPGLPAFFAVVGFVAVKMNNKVFFVFTVILLVLNIASIRLGEKYYWAATRGRLAEKLLQDVKNLYPSLSPGSVLFIKNDPNYPFVSKDWGGTSKQAKFILNGQDALRLVYKDPKLQIQYEDEGNEIPENAYQITAKIN